MFRCCTDRQRERDRQTADRQTGANVSELDRIKYRDAELRKARSEIPALFRCRLFKPSKTLDTCELPSDQSALIPYCRPFTARVATLQSAVVPDGLCWTETSGALCTNL
jgi:hypothetical protein